MRPADGGGDGLKIVDIGAFEAPGTILAVPSLSTTGVLAMIALFVSAGLALLSSRFS